MSASSHDPKSSPSAESQDSLQDSLNELAANVDSLVDGLTMDLGDQPVEPEAAASNHAAPPMPEPAPAPPAPVQQAAKVQTAAEPSNDRELHDLAKDMVDSLTQDELPAPAAATPAPRAQAIPAEPVVPWANKGQSIPTAAGGRRSYGWVAALVLFIGVAGGAAWMLFPDRTPQPATVAENLGATSEPADSPAIARPAQIVPVAEALSPRDLSGLPAGADIGPEPVAPAKSESTKTAPMPKPAPPPKAPVKTTPKKIEKVVTQPVVTQPEPVVTKPEPKPEPVVSKPEPTPEPKTETVVSAPPKAEPELPRNAAVARSVAQPTPLPLQPEPQPLPAIASIVPEPQPKIEPKPEPPVVKPKALPKPAPTVTAVGAPAGTTGPAVTNEPPKLISREEPVYTDIARKRGDKGVVELRVLVNSQGRVVRVVVEQGIPGSDLEARAIEAALRSNYSPALEAGQPAEAWVSERFVFEP